MIEITAHVDRGFLPTGEGSEPIPPSQKPSQGAPPCCDPRGLDEETAAAQEGDTVEQGQASGDQPEPGLDHSLSQEQEAQGSFRKVKKHSRGRPFWKEVMRGRQNTCVEESLLSKIEN